jgi:hypothetical protein
MNNQSECMKCDQIIYGCRICDEIGKCILCSIGYYFDSNICKLCRSTMIGCSQCSSNTHCVSCDFGYFLNESNQC